MNYIRNRQYQEIYEDFFQHYFDLLPQDIKEEFNIINENFFNKLKSRFPRAAEVSNILSDKAEKALQGVINKAKNAVNFVKKIVNNVVNNFKKNLKILVEKAKDLFKDSEILKKFKDQDKETILKDIKVSRKVASWYQDNFLSSIAQQIQNNLTKHLKGDVEPIAESKGNVISTLVHSLESVPPFSWLHKVKEAAEKGANQFIDFLSNITKKLGGPEFQLPVIASLIGVGLEQLIKDAVGSPVINLLGGPTSPFGAAIVGLKYIAVFIAIIVAIDSLIGKEILSSH